MPIFTNLNETISRSRRKGESIAQMSDSWKQDLADLIVRARREGKWLWCHYQNLWFSPDQLAAENAKGSFVWGVCNWELRDPIERLREAESNVTRAETEVARVRAEISQCKPL